MSLAWESLRLLLELDLFWSAATADDDCEEDVWLPSLIAALRVNTGVLDWLLGLLLLTSIVNLIFSVPRGTGLVVLSPHPLLLPLLCLLSVVEWLSLTENFTSLTLPLPLIYCDVWVWYCRLLALRSFCWWICFFSGLIRGLHPVEAVPFVFGLTLPIVLAVAGCLSTTTSEKHTCTSLSNKWITTKLGPHVYLIILWVQVSMLSYSTWFYKNWSISDKQV